MGDIANFAIKWRHYIYILLNDFLFCNKEEIFFNIVKGEKYDISLVQNGHLKSTRRDLEIFFIHKFIFTF